MADLFANRGILRPKDIAAELDNVLKLCEFPNDGSNNGLQVDSPDRNVAKICCGVDASIEFFQKAFDKNADMCVVHHGLSWGNSLARITGVNYRLISFLIEHKIALYAAHLPIDAHPVLGNNAALVKLLGLTGVKPFGDYHGMTIGFIGELPSVLSFDAFCGIVRTLPHVMQTKEFDFGKKNVLKIAVVSGGAADMAEQAFAAGADAYFTGEADLQAYNVCKHLEMNMVAAGHYATECGGVENVGRYITQKFGLETEFIDFELPY